MRPASNKKEITMKKIPLTFVALLVLLRAVPTLGAGEITVTILYDNTIAAEGVRSDWGYSCLFEGTEQNILFDAGTKEEIFFHNIDVLKANTKDVGLVVITHEHGDHTGGLDKILKQNAGISVYHPASFSKDFVSSVTASGAKAIPVAEPVEICKDVFLIGEMGDAIKETAMVLKTAKGLVLATGCSHPGIVKMVEKTKAIFDEDVYMVFGGFHLMDHSDAAVQEIISRFKALGVRKCGATHCTGEKQIKLFREAFGEDFVSLGVGKVLTLGSPQ
jgi:7,8-dihydropterin-6-yl-methyl-4-(beta-D-ribofuranosyl)aminobenzene 5'-phosphate synthase